MSLSGHAVGIGTMFLQFLLGSLGSFGGGQGMFAVVQQEFVSKGFLPAGLYSLSMALGQVSPGPLSVAVVGMGFVMNGVLGALIAVVILAAPMSLIVILSSSKVIGKSMTALTRESEAPLRWLVPSLSIYIAWGLLVGTQADPSYLAMGIALAIAVFALGLLTKIELSKLIIGGIAISTVVVIVQYSF